MILQISSEAPLAVRLGAQALLYLHIGGGLTGVAAGTVAMASRKGGRLHRAIGHLFFAAMLVMSGIGAVVAPFLPDVGSALGGAITFYLVATAWMTVMRPPGAVGVLDVGVFLMPVAGALACLGVADMAWNEPHHAIKGISFVVPIIVALVAALAAGLDLKVILKGGISGFERLRRHIWRMCVAMFVAVGSAAGQPALWPHALRGSPVLFLPMLAVLGLMTWWLVRNRAKRAPARRLPPTALPAAA